MDANRTRHRVFEFSTDYKVFRPIYIPPNLIMEQPHYGVLGGYSDGFTQSEQDFYVNGEEYPALVLIEDKSVGQLSSAIGGPVKIGQYYGEYYEEFGQRTVQLVRDGTWIFLEADQQLMTKADLLQVANSLALVPQR